MFSVLSTSLYLFFIFSSVFAFNHPGLLVNDGDISRIKTKLSTQTNPWQASWNKLVSLRYSQSTYANQAVSRAHRGTYNGAAANADLLWHDVAAAFNLAVRWKVEGNASYAETASNILGAWGRTLKALDDSDDQYLLAGLQGYQLVNAAELLRDYAPFKSSGNAQAFTTMFEEVFLYRNLFFLNHRAGSEHNHKHFHANWELCNMASAMAFGVYTDNATIFDFVVEYFKSGTGNGAINNAITDLVLEPGTGVVMGQSQESGRDQGHTGLDFQLLGAVAQQAWNQGVDLYGYNNSRILQGAEYYARYNLGNDVSFEPWSNGIVSFTKISSASRGATRPTWELLHAHYVKIKGLEAPWTTLYKNRTADSAKGGYEVGIGSGGEGSGHFDGLGWGSLLHRLGDDDVPAIPSTYSASHPTTSSSRAVLSSTSTVLPKTSAYATNSVSTSVGIYAVSRSSTLSTTKTSQSISTSTGMYVASRSSTSSKSSTLATTKTSQSVSTSAGMYAVSRSNTSSQPSTLATTTSKSVSTSTSIYALSQSSTVATTRTSQLISTSAGKYALSQSKASSLSSTVGTTTRSQSVSTSAGMYVVSQSSKLATTKTSQSVSTSAGMYAVSRSNTSSQPSTLATPTRSKLVSTSAGIYALPESSASSQHSTLATITTSQSVSGTTSVPTPASKKTSASYGHKHMSGVHKHASAAHNRVSATHTQTSTSCDGQRYTRI